MPLSLEGIRVLDLTDSIVGPFTTMLLGTCGAEVIRIESRNHLGFRASGPWRSGVSSPVPPIPESQIDFSKVDIGLLRGPLFSQLNYNKLSVALNLTRPEGQAIFRKLVKVSDIVVENFRFGVMQKWGFDYRSLKEIKNDIILLSLEAMGRGPYESWTTWGMNLLSYSGFSHAWGHPGTPETERAASGYHGDYVSGAGAAVALLAALLYRAGTGCGQYLEISQAEATAAALGVNYLDYFVNHRLRPPLGNRHPQFAPCNCYRCQGHDRWCVIAIFNESEWQQFCSALENPGWTQEPKFQSMSGRLENIDELDRHIEDWTKTRTPHQIMNLLQTFGISAGAVQNGEDLYYDLELRERSYMATQAIPRMGNVTLSGPPFRLSEGQEVKPRQAPALGEHNDYVYRQVLGLSQKELDDLVKSQIAY